MDPCISYGSNKENIPPFSSPSTKHGLRPSQPISKCKKVARRRTPLEDITHLFADSVDPDLVSSGDDALVCLRYASSAPRRTFQGKTKAPVTQRTCRLSLRKSFR